MLKVESEKTTEEYSAKAEEARRWLRRNAGEDVGDFNEQDYPFMNIEIDAKNITPRECAESIDAAIRRTDGDIGPLEKARRRIQLRESLNTSSLKLLVGQ